MMEHPGSDSPTSNFRSQLNSRLLDARTVVINEPLTTSVAGQVSEQLTVLAAESDEPIQVVMSTVPGGDAEAGLSTYDLIRSLTVPVTMLGSGRVAGAGVLAFVGAADLEATARAAADRRARIVTLLAEATGQLEEQIDRDLSSQRAFEADAAASYGLLRRVVQNRRDVS